MRGVRPGFWVAFAALAAAFLILVPTLAPLSGSMDAFSQDLANGTFRPFGPTAGSGLRGFSDALGGFTGESAGNYMPGSSDVPQTWVMDRDGRGGAVVVDAYLNPNLGAMKRLKAYDRVGADGTTLEVADKRFRPATADPFLRYEQVFEGSFDVQLHAGEPVPIYSPHPKAVVTTYRTDPGVKGGVTFLRDGADTLYALAAEDAVVAMNLTYLSDPSYYRLDVPEGLTPQDYAAAVRPVVAPALVEDAKIVLARAGVDDARDLTSTLRALVTYFRSFTEGDIPAPAEVESLYLALSLGGHGCCRHRAFAFMVTAQAAGVPTRVVVNEAHAFVEVMLPDGSWYQANLGGCGTYTSNNPNGYRDYFAQAADPRLEANPNENRPRPQVATFTNITESPTRILKGERYFVNGTVESPGRRAVAGARIDVYLNETKDSPGRLTGAGVTDANGLFSIVARVPKELPARNYQLVARAADPGTATVRYIESWSDPEVNVFAPTQLVFPPISAAAGFPTNVTGRLVDIDNNPVAGAPIQWSADGIVRPAMLTDATGRFSGSVRFDAIGDHRVDVAYAGGEHYGNTSRSLMIRAERGAILLPPEAPTVARNESGSLTGHAAAAGVALGGKRVVATITVPANLTTTASRLVATGEAVTRADGSFIVPVRIDARRAPGLYDVAYSVPELNLSAASLVRVAVRPTLVVDAASSLAAGDAWVVRATLASDNGTALAGGIVEVTIDGNATTARALLTNRTGVARFEFPALPIGARRVEVSFPGDALHVDASETLAVEVLRPWYAAIPRAAYAALLGALLLVGGVTWLLRPGTAARAFLARRMGARAPRRTIEVEFPDHPQGIPAVFEAGESIRARLRVRHRDGRHVPSRVVVLGPGKRRSARVPPEGWLIELPAEEGALLCARAGGLGRISTAPLVVALPVRPYRQAVEEGFVALRRAARLDPSASAGDLVRTLEKRVPPERRAPLWRAAALFDEADYSERPVDRAFYHAFAAARRDVERTLEESGG